MNFHVPFIFPSYNKLIKEKKKKLHNKEETKMMKKFYVLLLALLLVIGAQEVLGEDLNAPESLKPIAALKVSLPDAEVNYLIREREDGRNEWKLFFKQKEALGVCKIWEDTNTIRKVELYDKGTENALTAEQAMAKLKEEKGDLTVVELDLDWDDGELRYEGEAEIDGKRYEFEMTAAGRVIEWERD